jgi:hypothetical protein
MPLTFHLGLGHLLMSLRYSVPLAVDGQFGSANSNSGRNLLCSSVMAVATAAAAATAAGGGGSRTAALMLIRLQAAALARLSQKRIIIASCTRNPSCILPFTSTVMFVLRKWFVVDRVGMMCRNFDRWQQSRTRTKKAGTNPVRWWTSD